MVKSGDLQDRKVALIGFADRVGAREYNQVLSLRRAIAIRSELIRLGVAPKQIVTIDGLGEEGAPIDTIDGVRDKRNRIVFLYAYE